MEITNTRISLRNEAKLKAYASITFDDCFVVRNLRVIEGKKGLFVAMPSKKRKDGTHQDIAHPITREMREKIENTVLDEYNKALSQQQSPSSQPIQEGQEEQGN